MSDEKFKPGEIVRVIPDDNDIQNGFHMIELGRILDPEARSTGPSHIRKVVFPLFGEPLSAKNQCLLEGGVITSWCGTSIVDGSEPVFVTVDAALHTPHTRKVCQACMDAIYAAMRGRNDLSAHAHVRAPMYSSPATKLGE